jgi:hypothetical protein
MSTHFTSNQDINPQAVKANSETIILEHGGKVLSWLPTLEQGTSKTIEQVIQRALALNAMYQLHLGAPKFIIASWINEHVTDSDAVPPYEQGILDSEEPLNEEEQFYLYWSLESLCALAWATNLLDELPFTAEVGDELADLSPSLHLNEDGQKYINHMNLRPYHELYQMLDLYYRVHWWLNDAVKANEPVAHIALGAIIQRRIALEWIMNSSVGWDDVDLSL